MLRFFSRDKTLSVSHNDQQQMVIPRLLKKSEICDLSMNDREAFLGRVTKLAKFRHKYSLLHRVFQVLSIILCIALLGPSIDSQGVVLWGAYMFAMAISHIILFFVYICSNSVVERRIAVLENIVQGLIAAGFGYVSLFLWPTSTAHEIGLICFLTFYVGNVMENSPTYFGLAITYAALTLGPLIVRLFFMESEIGLIGGMFESLIFVYLCWRSNALMKKEAESIVRKIKSNRLLVDAVRENKKNIKARKSNSDLLTAASHDLRQPIHAIRLFISNSEFLDPQDKVGRQENMEKINMAFQSMEEMIDSLLNISYLSSDKFSLTLGPVAIDEMLSRICSELNILAKDNGCAIRLVKSSLYVESNPMWLDRLLRNLLGNAIKYAPQGRVLVGVRRSGNYARIQVLDTGVGIPEPQIKLIFDEFRTFGREGVKGRGSLGLGLAIVSRISELLDLKVNVKSEVGKGSVFSVEVPLANSESTIFPEQPGL